MPEFSPLCCSRHGLPVPLYPTPAVSHNSGMSLSVMATRHQHMWNFCSYVLPAWMVRSSL